MCVVIPAIASLALTGLSAGVSYLGQQQAASQQEAYQQQVYQQQQQQAVDQQNYQNQQVTANNEYVTQNAENVRAVLAADRSALISQERQDGLATSVELEQKRIERLRSVGSIQASERAGLSLDSLMSDFYQQEAQYRNISEQNLAFSSGQRQLEGDKLTATARSRINEARPYEQAPVNTPFAPAPVTRPSLFGAVLGTAAQLNSQAQSLSTYDPYSGRYRLTNNRTSFNPTPTISSAPARNFSTGFRSSVVGSPLYSSKSVIE